jgi:uncharacterized protein YdcH (DUF465 family)|tara:strand:- start:163 stop:381 length:219 start_codon:yes stop_codon:yes gene_type:complete
MAGKSKKLKKLEDHHRYLNKKVAELTEDRKTDRSSESKSILMRLKKTKLAIKDEMVKIQNKLKTLTNKKDIL